MMTRDVLLDLELDEEDDEDGDIGEQGVRARAHAGEVGHGAWALHPPRGGVRGPPAAPRRASGRAGARGREKEARAAVLGAAMRRPTAPGKAREARARSGPEDRPWTGKDAPRDSHRRPGDAAACGSLDSETTTFGSFPPPRSSAGISAKPARVDEPGDWGGLGCDRLDPLEVKRMPGSGGQDGGRGSGRGTDLWPRTGSSFHPRAREVVAEVGALR